MRRAAKAKILVASKILLLWKSSTWDLHRRRVIMRTCINRAFCANYFANVSPLCSAHV